MAVNQKHGIPRIHGGTPFATRRSHFLDSTQKCFYGPGQPPDSGHQNGVDQFGGETTKAYQPPEDWPNEKTLLRVPQVVFLSKKLVQGAISIPLTLAYWTDYYSFVPHAAIGIVVHKVVGGFSCDTAFVDPSDHYWSTFEVTATLALIPTDDPERVEDARLHGIFQDISNRLAMLRPNRTFATYWQGWNIKGDTVDGAFGMDQTMDHMLAPPLAEDTYFGTDFLHVYCGLPVCHGSGGFGFATHVFGGLTIMPIPYTSSAHFNSVTPTDNSFFVSSLARVTSAGEMFRRYESWVYASRFNANGISWTSKGSVTGGSATGVLQHIKEHPDSVYDFSDSAPSDPTCDSITFTYDPGDTTLTNTFASNPDFLYASAPVVSGGDLDNAADATRLLLNANEESAGQFLKAMCDGAHDQGVIFQGVTTDITADGLMAMIADHFGFDPETGKDL